MMTMPHMSVLWVSSFQPLLLSDLVRALEVMDAGALPVVDAGLGAIAADKAVTGWYVWW